MRRAVDAARSRYPGRRGSWAFYDAACCYALDGRRDLAFTALDAAIAEGYRDVDHLLVDEDLATLRTDARWPGAVAAARAAFAAWEHTLVFPDLRRQLLAMDKDDQAARNAWIAAPRDSAAARALGMKVMDIDKRDTAALKAMVDAHGWPGVSLMGKDGAHAAWLLVQHADQDLAFQKRCLVLLEATVARGDAAPDEYAYLYDRVAVAEKRLQRYGTQIMGTEPAPLEDPANVDARRASVGLGTLADYLRHFPE